ncbi:MAG: substrate-binding domain-containing protein [Calditrichae bacterium]|nr:substrate-binding domain-containing protein [Calditrichia bacterium]
MAKKAGVSVATVSLVVHDNKRISSQTRTKVLKAIKELKYHPSRSARGLVSRRSGNIGFILREDHFSRSEPFYTKIFLGTEFQAREDEYYILLTTVPSCFEPGNKLPRFVLERNVDGIILAGKVPQNLINGLEQYKMPLVFVDYYPPSGKYPAVMIDNIAGGLNATEHLIQCGHQRIAYLAGDFEHPSILERFQGYKMALEKAGLPFTPEYTVLGEELPDRSGGYNAVKKLFQRTRTITAIFTCNDAVATGVLQYLKEEHIRVPEDISVIGFDDVEADIMLDPPLTTMRVPKEDVGVQALRLMVESIQSDRPKPKKILVPVELIVRGSTCHIN